MVDVLTPRLRILLEWASARCWEFHISTQLRLLQMGWGPRVKHCVKLIATLFALSDHLLPSPPPGKDPRNPGQFITFIPSHHWTAYRAARRVSRRARGQISARVGNLFLFWNLHCTSYEGEARSGCNPPDFAKKKKYPAQRVPFHINSIHNTLTLPQPWSSNVEFLPLYCLELLLFFFPLESA